MPKPSSKTTTRQPSTPQPEPAANAESEQPKLWERQPYETATAYQYFAEFYLPQQQPRSVVEAYRHWRQKRGRAGAEIPAIGKVPGHWNRWAYSTDRQGRRIPGTHTWAERATARDAHLIFVSQQEEEKLWRTRKRKIHESEFAMGEKLMQRAERMQAKRLFEREEKDVITVDGEEVPQRIIYQPDGWSELDIAKLAKVASELMRRGAQMPVGQLETDWRRELAQHFPDVDPDEVQQLFANVFTDLLTSKGHTF